MWNIAALNGFTVWNSKYPEFLKKCKYRKSFFLELGQVLSVHNAKEGLKNKDLPKRVAEIIKILIPEESNLNLNTDEQPTVSLSSKKCTIYPRKEDKSTRKKSQQYNRFICSLHNGVKKSVLRTICKCNDNE